jgi:4-hydroxy-tetrahydrodipicolinate synthase
VKNVVADEESARRFTDLINRYILMAGLNDVALQGMFLGTTGRISGLTSASPQESVALIATYNRGDFEEAPHRRFLCC